MTQPTDQAASVWNFGFTVEQVPPRDPETYERLPAAPDSPWRAYLPHQCDAWDIAGDEHEGVPRAEAVTELEAFIAEAQQALAALRNSQPYGGDDDTD